jgi:glucose/arabinose dehydrogenase
MRAPRRALALAATVALVLAGLAGSAYAAPTRYESENSPAVCDGTIDSNWAGFSGTGFCNTVNAVGGSVTWTVNAANAGTATLGIRYANGTTTDRPADVVVNGTTAVSAVSFAGTGAWTTWVTKTVTVQVNAGSNTIRLAGTTANGDANIDFLDFEVAPAFTDIQAETCTLTASVVESNHLGFTGTGFVNGDNAVGSGITCSTNAATAGPRSLEIRFANGTTTVRPMDLVVNGTTVTNIVFQGTTDWDTWATLTVNINLNAGANTIRLTATTVNGGPNLDRLRIAAPLDTQAPTTPGQPICDPIVQDTMTLTWPESTDNIGVVAYDIYHDGTLYASPAHSPFTLTDLNFNFTYRWSIFARDAAGNVSTTSPLATTPSGGGCVTGASSDTQAPTAPTNLVHSNVTQTTVDLTWTASTDNVGVRSYVVRNASNAALFTVSGNPPVTSAHVTGLSCATAYTLHVVAKDKAGNTSAMSNTRSFTTSACSRGTPQSPTTVAGSWDVPWDICWEPGGAYALVTERDTFRVFKLTPSGTKTQIGTVPNSVTTDGEGGLMGCAPSPTWNGTTDTDWFFMHTSNDGGTTQNRVIKMTFNGSTLTNRVVILGGIRSSRFHNGGRIRFGPDGFLYVTTGDSQQQDLAQDVNSLNGKVLRITKTGAAAPGNPFGTRIYSYGHRNPQGLGWDSAGRLWEAEFGNATWDEVNLITPGANYGWPICEGSCTTAGMTNPKWQKGVASCSCSGFAIVNDTIYLGALRGTRLWRLELTGTSVTNESSYFVGTYGRIRAVTKVPSDNAIWFGTSNSDNNGDGTPDVIRQSLIR